MIQAQSTTVIEGRPIAWIAGVLAAGPAFVFVYMWSVMMYLPTAFFLFVLSVPFALIIASIPMGIAVMLGGWMGTRWRATRHPAIWGLVGSLAGAALAPVLEGVIPRQHVAMIVAGAITALVARRFMAWVDPIAGPPAVS